MLEYKVTLNDEDYLQLNKYHFLNSINGKKTLLAYRFVPPVIFFMIVVILFVIDSDFELILFESIVMIIMSALWIAYSKKILFKNMKKEIERVKKEGKLPYSKDALLRFDDEGIHEITPNSENKSQYSLIEKIAVTENAIYIFISAVQAYILPVTTFSDEAEKLKFLDFIELKSNVLREIKS